MGRQEERKRMVLPVKVHGSNARGEPFSEMGCVTDISQNGARIEGAQCIKNVNEIITLEHQGARVQFRVAWVGEAGTRLAGTAGLQTLLPQKVMFGIELPPPGPDSFDPTIPHGVLDRPSGAIERPSGIIDRRVIERRHQQERRKSPRYKCTGSAEMRKDGAGLAIWGKVSDLCVGGCYVEISAPLPVDTPLDVILSVCDEQLRTRALVRSNHPGFGMGMRFVEPAPEQAEILARIIQRLAGGVPPPKSKIEAPAARPAVPVAAVLQPLIDWFRTHETLSRADFLRLIQPKKAEEPKTAEVAVAH